MHERHCSNENKLQLKQKAKIAAPRNWDPIVEKLFLMFLLGYPDWTKWSEWTKNCQFSLSGQYNYSNYDDDQQNNSTSYTSN